MKTSKIFNRFLVGGLLLTALSGCGSSNSAAPVFQAAQHVTGWETAVSHGLQYVGDPNQCRECHGQDLLGGTSKITCNNTCHVHSVPVGPFYSDWASAHGDMAKGDPGVLNNHVISGYLSCQNCHGADYMGTALSHNVDCYSNCHVHTVGVPHDAWNGRSNDWMQHTHADVSEQNAAACYQCHNRVKHHRFRYFTGSIYFPTYSNYTTFNSLLSTRDGAPAGTAPGCFNNTMCHTDLRAASTPPASIWPPPTSPALNPPVWPAAGASNQ